MPVVISLIHMDWFCIILCKNYRHIDFAWATGMRHACTCILIKHAFINGTILYSLQLLFELRFNISIAELYAVLLWTIHTSFRLDILRGTRNCALKYSELGPFCEKWSYLSLLKPVQQTQYWTDEKLYHLFACCLKRTSIFTVRDIQEPKI